MPPFLTITPRARGGRTSGFTLVELIITMAILVVASGILARTLAGTAGMRSVNRENALAVEGARQVLELMRDEPFDELWARYNSDPTDDPGGAGTAPGPYFEVAGLTAITGFEGRQGEIVLPAVEVQVEQVQGEGEAPQTELVWQVREDVVDDALGMPRDLNGDNVVDDGDHSEDYIILPVCVRVSWEGLNGQRSTEMHTMFTRFKKKY